MFYQQKKREKPVMAMAPLIDMIFLLLVFFMVATVFPDNVGVDVEKPEADTSKALQKDHLLFAITKEGAIWHSEKEITLDETLTILSAAARIKPDTAVIVQPDKKAETQYLVGFLDVARKGRRLKHRNSHRRRAGKMSPGLRWGLSWSSALLTNTILFGAIALLIGQVPTQKAVEAIPIRLITIPPKKIEPPKPIPKKRPKITKKKKIRQKVKPKPIKKKIVGLSKKIEPPPPPPVEQKPPPPPETGLSTALFSLGPAHFRPTSRSGISGGATFFRSGGKGHGGSVDRRHRFCPLYPDSKERWRSF